MSRLHGYCVFCDVFKPETVPLTEFKGAGVLLSPEFCLQAQSVLIPSSLGINARIQMPELAPVA